MLCLFFFKQKTAYEMRISDWSSDVCSSDLEVIDQRLVGEGDRGDFGRQGKHDVEIADREQVGLAGLEPGARRGALALGAMPVAATVVGDPPKIGRAHV